MTLIGNSEPIKIYKRNRPTIGILAGWSTLEGTTPDHYRTSVIKGIQYAARNRGCNLLLSWGIRRITEVERIYAAWPVVSAGSDFIPVGPWNTDGLIVFTPLGSEERSAYLQHLIGEGFPILFIATGENGPTVAVNNEQGIRQAVAHLAEHGHRRIAFIAGLPTDMGDSAVRLETYSKALIECGLEVDPALVAWGWHDFIVGQRAMQELLRSKVKFTAVLASNDNSAIGAMQALRDAGLRIPRDIAIIGFDDQPIAAAQVPPLSSVHISLANLGEQALVGMLDQISGHLALPLIQIPTRVVPRQSCGCMPDVISAVLDGPLQATPRSFGRKSRRPSVQVSQKHLVQKMLDVLPAEMRFPGEEELRTTCSLLVDGFYRSLADSSPTLFQTAFIDCIQELEMLDGNLEPWQRMISALRREMTLLPLQWEAAETCQLAEDLIHQARVIIAESAQRQDKRHEYQRAVKALALNGLTAALSATMNENQVARVLKTHLQGLGIRHAFVQLFEAEREDPVAWSLTLNSEEGEALRRFPSRQFPPQALCEDDELMNLILLPLVFQGEALGYAAFDASDLGACAVIAMQLAATIKVSRLHARVVELSLTDPLTGLHNRRYFELFLKSEIGRSQRFSRSLAVIFVDVDYFKEYNDLYGHPAGDMALQRVAKCLLDALRKADIVARVGGDEFVIVLPETDIRGALAVSRKIRMAIPKLSGLKTSLSVSIGLAAVNSPSIDAETLIKQADTALYESKRGGRNRISIYSVSGVVDEIDDRSTAG